MVDDTSAVGDDSRSWVVHPVNKIAVNYHEGEMDPSGFRVWWNFSSLRDIFVPHIGSAWRARHDNNNNNNRSVWKMRDEGGQVSEKR